MDTLQERDAVPDHAKLFFSGRLACQTRNAEGLEAILREYFHIPAEVQPFTGQQVGRQLILTPGRQKKPLTRLDIAGLGGDNNQSRVRTHSNDDCQ